MALLDKFSELGESISSKSRSVVQKAKDATEAAGLNSQINALDGRLRELYEQLGRAYFAAQGGATEEMAGLVQQIRDTLDEQDALREQVKKVRGITCCENCGRELTPGTAFCPECGTKVPEPPAPVVRCCVSCGLPIPDEAVFCPNCGTSQNA